MNKVTICALSVQILPKYHILHATTSNVCTFLLCCLAAKVHVYQGNKVLHPVHPLLLLLHYYTRFKHVKSFTKVKNLKCERSQCHRRNARLYRAALSLDLKVAMLTVISDVTVSKSVQWCKQDLNLPRTWTIHLCRQRQRHYASEHHHCQPPQHAAACLYLLTSVFAAAVACGTAAWQRTVHTDNTV